LGTKLSTRARYSDPARNKRKEEPIANTTFRAAPESLLTAAEIPKDKIHIYRSIGKLLFAGDKRGIKRPAPTV